MEQLKLTQQEQVFYGEYFQTCDADGSGKISNSRASDLFVCSGLSPEVLLKVRVRCSAYKTLNFCQPKLSARSCHLLSAVHEVYHINMFYYYISCICLQFTSEGFSIIYIIHGTCQLKQIKEMILHKIKDFFHRLISICYTK